MGNRAILTGPSVEGMGSLSSTEALDANATSTPDYTEERTVDGKSVYLSPDDAKKLDAEKQDEGRAFKVVPNGSTFERLKEFFSPPFGGAP